MKYRLILSRGIVPLFRGCDLDLDTNALTEQESKELVGLVEESGILRIQSAVVTDVVLAGSGRSWNLDVEKDGQHHRVMSSTQSGSRPSVEDNNLKLDRLLSFVERHLEEMEPGQ